MTRFKHINNEYYAHPETCRNRWFIVDGEVQSDCEENINTNKYHRQAKHSQDKPWHELNQMPQSDTNSLKVLNTVFNNAEMAKSSISHTMEHVTNDKFKKILTDQISKYDDFIARACTLASELNTELVNTNLIGKMMATANIHMKLLTNSTTENIAEMMLIGTTMGIIDIGKVLRHTADVSSGVLKLARELLIYEEDKVELMKYFL